MTVDPAALSNNDLTVSLTDDGTVLWVTLDRPEKRNALNTRMMRGLVEVTAAVDGSDVTVVVIRGAAQTFSSGGDLEDVDERGSMTPVERRDNELGLSALYDGLRSMDALAVAAVEGYCLAGGCAVATACDFIVAADDATFGLPEANVGMFPMQAMLPFMRAVPEKRGLKYLFTGEFFDAAEAYDLGLLTDVYDAGDFEDELAAFVATLAGNSPVMISLGKEAYYVQREMDFERAHKYLADMLLLLTLSDDHEEGIQAFLEDREPQWTGQ